MVVRRSTRGWLVMLGLIVLMGLVGTMVYELPARPSSAVGRVDIALPQTTEVVVDGTPVAQFPPPPGETHTRLAVDGAARAVATGTTLVTFTDSLQARQPYTPSSSVTLQQELDIPAAELAALVPALSEHRSYAPAEEPQLGVTTETRAIAQRYLAAFNSIRATQGLMPLTWDDDLAQRAEGHAATRLWYFLLDGGRQVAGPRDQQIDAYFGIVNSPRYASLGMSSHGMPTNLLTDGADEAAIIDSLTDDAGTSLYGAGSLPVSRIGVGIAVAYNGTALVPHGWLTIVFQ